MFTEEELKELAHITPDYQKGVPICAAGCNGGFAWCKQNGWQIIGGPCVAGLIRDVKERLEEIALIEKERDTFEKERDEARRDFCEAEIYADRDAYACAAIPIANLRKIAKSYDWEYLYPKRGKKNV